MIVGLAFAFIMGMCLKQNVADASASSGSWHAYYYNNQDLSGNPVNSKVINYGQNSSFEEDNGHGSPMAKVNANHFSAKYVTEENLPSGDYVIRTRADDGVKVLVDGKNVLNRWTDGGYHENAVKVHITDTSKGDLHSIEVLYYDNISVSHIYTSIEPYSIPTDNWIGEFYPNETFKGNPVILGGKGALKPLSELNFNWAKNSPIELIPKDHFSAIFTKTANITSSGTYKINVAADDGVKVTVDGKIVINSWNQGSHQDINGMVDLSKGTHTVKVDYFDYSSTAKINFSLKKIPEEDWVATYYNNENLSGSPVNSQVIPHGSNGSLDENNGRHAPMAKVNDDHFSAKYVSSKHLTAGDYVIRTRADDGAMVYVDGKVVLNRWTDGGYHENAVKVHLTNTSAGDLHTIEVRYYDKTSVSHIYTSIEPFEIPDDSWIGEYYSNESFQGNAVIQGGDNALKALPDLNLDWGDGSPIELLPKDHFSANYQRTYKVQNSGMYQINVIANDGVKVQVDGKLVIDSWKNSNNEKRSALVQLTAGSHKVKVDYYDYSQAADIHFSMTPVPTDDWLATYYNNESLSGKAINSQVISHGANGSFDENNGRKAPMDDVNVNHFSAKYVSQKHLNAGDYIIRTRADDGAKVYVDGKLVLNRWSDGGYHENAVKVHLTNTSAGDLHTIEVHYYDKTSVSHVYTSIEPYKISTDGWIGEYYANDDLKGDAIIQGGSNALKPLSDLNLNWGKGSPLELIPADHFSASFNKIMKVSSSGIYNISVTANDGVRVKVDGKTVIDSWKNSNNERRDGLVNLPSGNHTISVEYYDYSQVADIKFSMNKVATDDWSAYYYNNENLSGNPIDEQVLSHGANGSLNQDNGKGSPTPKVNFDHFSAKYISQKHLSAGDYIIRMRADDGAKVYVDGNQVIDHWTDGGYNENAVKVHLTNNSNGDLHTIEVRYYDKTSTSHIFTSIEKYKVPANTWIGEYYSNDSFAGNAIIQGGDTALKPLKDIEINGTSDPMIKTLPDHFSARFVSNKNISAGDYIFRTKANDGVKIIIDGKTVIDQFNSKGYKEYAAKVKLENINGSTLHNIEIQYKDYSSTARLSLSVEPYNIPSTNWQAEYYPNDKLAGTATVIGGDYSLNDIGSIDFDWGKGAPVSGMPVDHFSARFTKNITIASTGTYKFTLNADDGVRLYVDNRLVVDSWENGAKTVNKEVDLAAGKHSVKLEYYDYTSSAHIHLFYDKVFKIVNEYKTTVYNYSLDDAVKAQSATSSDYANNTGPKTDQHPYSINGYISASGLHVSGTKGTIVNGPYNMRKCAGTGSDCTVLDVLRTNETVTILDKLTVDGSPWYHVNYVMDTWEVANAEEIKPYLDPLNFKIGTNAYYQFLKLNSSANLNPNEVNDKILKGMGILEGKATSFIQAGQTYHINEIYLIAHAMLETGNGGSQLANGVCYDPKSDAVISSCSTPVYNMYGIGAYDSTALKDGAAFAYHHGWDSPEKAIIGGASFIDSNYVGAGQDTLYKMKWNPDHPGSHEYATDIGWAVKQTNRISQLYGLLTSYSNVYDIPKYQ